MPFWHFLHQDRGFLPFSYYFKIPQFPQKIVFFFLPVNKSSRFVFQSIIHIQNLNSIEMNPTLKKIWFFKNFCCYETKFTITKKFTDFCVTGNFLVSVEITYCRSGVIVFQFNQELNTVQSKNFALSQGILHILPVFGKIIVY